MVLVSVLLASNRVDDQFYQAIGSILEQSFKELELIVVLNGAAVVDKFAVEQRFSKYSNINVLSVNLSGLNFALNFGLNYASGKYIARMDADDISYVDRISTQFEFLEKNSDIAVCGSWYNLIDEKGCIQGIKSLPISNSEIRSSLTFKNPICHPSVMYRKALVCNAGAYLNGQYAEDYDLWVRLLRDPTIGFANIGIPLLGYRINGGGDARGSMAAYASVSSSQWGQFIFTRNPKWLLAAIASLFKALLWGR
ncbi:glycosyltransferase [Polynucleobacter paneuropaeus]|nr:glycosyltransferase [Polynucleobacter paneuropaeus]